MHVYCTIIPSPSPLTLEYATRLLSNLPILPQTTGTKFQTNTLSSFGLIPTSWSAMVEDLDSTKWQWLLKTTSIKARSQLAAVIKNTQKEPQEHKSRIKEALAKTQRTCQDVSLLLDASKTSSSRHTACWLWTVGLLGELDGKIPFWQMRNASRDWILIKHISKETPRFR